MMEQAHLKPASACCTLDVSPARQLFITHKEHKGLRKSKINFFTLRHVRPGLDTRPPICKTPEAVAPSPGAASQRVVRFCLGSA
jgi:hypothetical protein